MHLNEQDIARAAEALSRGTYNQIDVALKEHLSTCSQCAMEVQTTSSIFDELKDKAALPSSRPKMSMLRLVSGIAASALITFGTWYVLDKLEMDEQPLVDNTLLQDSVQLVESNEQAPLAELSSNSEEEAIVVTPQAALQNQDLLAYQSHKDLELLVARFEEGALRGEGISFFVPSTLEGGVDGVKITWENPNEEELILEFFNNLGDKLFESTTNLSYISPTLDKPGLYYYKVLNEDFDMIFCGRIIVKKN